MPTSSEREILLGNPLDTVRFGFRDVPVLAQTALYLIEISRRDAAYVHVSLAMHLVVTHGTARYCVDEASKRVFFLDCLCSRSMVKLLDGQTTNTCE